jgi:hypothetical protein
MGVGRGKVQATGYLCRKPAKLIAVADLVTCSKYLFTPHNGLWMFLSIQLLSNGTSLVCTD